VENTSHRLPRTKTFSEVGAVISNQSTDLVAVLRQRRS
jgi:hypothetical protein